MGGQQLRFVSAGDPVAVARASRPGGRLMRSFPIFMTLRGRRALVVGGTDAAFHKIELLLAAEACAGAPPGRPLRLEIE